MRQYIILFIAAILSLTSCGNTDPFKKDIAPSTLKVDGLIGEYIQVVDTVYSTKNLGTDEDIKLAITVTFEAIDNPTNYLFLGSNEPTLISFYDIDGFSLNESYDKWSGLSHNEFARLLSSEPGSKVTVTFMPTKNYKLDELSEIEDFFKKVASFSVEETCVHKKKGMDLKQTELSAKVQKIVYDKWESILNNYSMSISSYIAQTKDGNDPASECLDSLDMYYAKLSYTSPSIPYMNDSQLEKFKDLNFKYEEAQKEYTQLVKENEAKAAAALKAAAAAKWKADQYAEIDDVIRVFEKSVNESDRLITRASNGDESVIVDAVALLQKMKRLQNRANNFQVKPTAAQLEKVQKIYSRFEELEKKANAIFN